MFCKNATIIDVEKISVKVNEQPTQSKFDVVNQPD